MAGSLIDPPPFQTPMVGQGGKISRWWADWILLSLLGRVQSQAPSFADARVNVQAQTAAIGTTALLPAASAGLYRVSWWTRIVTAAGVSSSVQVSVQAVDGGVNVTQSGAALTGNTTATCQGGTAIVRCDGASALSYAVAYASNPASAAAYDLAMTVEAL